MLRLLGFLPFSSFRGLGVEHRRRRGFALPFRLYLRRFGAREGKRKKCFGRKDTESRSKMSGVDLTTLNYTVLVPYNDSIATGGDSVGGNVNLYYQVSPYQEAESPWGA